MADFDQRNLKANNVYNADIINNNITLGKTEKDELKEALDYINTSYNVIKDVFKIGSTFSGWLDKRKDEKNRKKASECMGKAFDLYNKRRFMDSVKEAYKALEFDVCNTTAHNHIAWVFSFYNKELDKAERHSRKANELMPNKVPYMDTLAEVYYARKDYALSFEVTTRALQILNVSDKDSMYLLNYRMGRLYLAAGDYQNAMNFLAKTLNFNYENEIFDRAGLYYNIALTFNALGNHDKSIEFINGAISLRKNEQFAAFRDSLLKSRGLSG
ncbi:photosystem I assembly protein Ycf3 [Ruminiclostridium hungatei]|uniref:Photosystem I assembly protein Ycf3 n=1 Tax=Ruminiclostridium hungatei TaxID=48256 RepID=A0A1V4SEH9_RUMHU|nr:hypothetical protein [Ruminiclostridium hungatei]OPX42319.1 photosystem I assembly protein Ycf3 [Ruminiclostridium hungatei]